MRDGVNRFGAFSFGLALTLSVALAITLSLASVSTAAVPADVIEFDPSVAHQTIEGMGANTFTYPIANDLGWQWDDVKFVFDELDIHYLRVVSWLANWESQNDNGDPNTIDWSGFDTPVSSVSQEDLPFAQYVTARGISYELGVWNAADWLANGNPRRIDPSDYPELGELVAAYLLYMEANGIPQPITEVQNEPAIQASIRYYTPDDLRDAGLAILDQLDAHGLDDVMLHGPNHHMPEDVAYWTTPWMSNARLASRTIAISYHTWWVDDFAPYDAIRQLGEQYGKPVWAAEIGYCALESGCFGGTHHLRPWTWATAWDYAMSYYRAIAWSRASRLYHWSLLGYDGLVSETGQRYPSFHVFKHFSNYIPPGSRYLASQSGDPEVLALIFEHASASSAILINTGTAAKSMKLAALGRESFRSVRHITSSDGAYEVSMGDDVTDEDGLLSIVLPPQSVTSLELRPVVLAPGIAAPWLAIYAFGLATTGVASIRRLRGAHRRNLRDTRLPRPIARVSSRTTTF
jgi:O-glycosyl hydrolase